MTLPPPIDWPDAGIGQGQDLPAERRVTRDNWRIYPFSRWGFQHTRELVPSRPLRPSPSPRPLPVQIAALDRLCFDDEAGQPITWAEFERRTYCDAIIILQHGMVVHEAYHNGMTPATPHHSFSVSKSFVGLLAEMLIADGTLDGAAPAALYVPEFSQTAFAAASVRDLLDMTDGAAFDEDYANPDAIVHRYSASYWSPALASCGAREALLQFTQCDHLPGGGFSYRTPVADALGWVIARANGQRLADLVTQRLWHPAGCCDDGHILVDLAGDEIAASGLNTTLRDMARLALMMAEGHQIPARARASIMEGGNRELFAASRYAERAAGSYRSQWWVSHDAHSSISALGVFGQRVQIDMDTGMIMVRFGSHPLASNLHTDKLHRLAMEALRRFLA